MAEVQTDAGWRRRRLSGGGNREGSDDQREEDWRAATHGGGNCALSGGAPELSWPKIGLSPLGLS